MAASSADKFTETKGSAGNPSVTTASAPRTVGGTSLTATALTNWPTGTQVHFITYSKNADGTKDNTSQQDWKGTVSSSTSLTSMALTNGTDAGNAIGDYIEMGPTASWAEDLYDGLTQTLNTDGTLQSSIVTTAKINDGAVTTAKLASGAVTSSTLAESAVTASKLDNSSFPTSVVEVGSNSTVVTGATFVSTTFAFVNGSTYLITGKTQQSSSSDGGVWVNTLEVNGVSIDTARYGGTLGTQMPATMIKVYVAAATASYTVSMVASRLSGSGTASVEVPTIQIVPLLH